MILLFFYEPITNRILMSFHLSLSWNVSLFVRNVFIVVKIITSWNMGIPLTPRTSMDQLTTGWHFPSFYFERNPMSFFPYFRLFPSVVLSASRPLASVSQFSVLEFFAPFRPLSFSQLFSRFWSPPNSPVFGVGRRTLRSGYRRCRAPL